jgi:hypothetical protein
MLIARSFSQRVKLAARAAGIEHVEYGVNFSFRVVGTTVVRSVPPKAHPRSPLPRAIALARTRSGSEQ